MRFTTTLFLILISLLFLASCSSLRERARSSGSSSLGNAHLEVFELPNELRVVTVSSPEFAQSSSALAVSVGTFANPPGKMGMAHFLEHMLFIGSEEYPRTNEFGNFIAQRGGATNATTNDTSTTYKFQIDASSLESALQRWSRFFVSPTFDPGFLEKEKKAIDSEHEIDRNKDSYAESTLRRRFAAKGHPLRVFGQGNLKSLKSVSRDDVVSFYERFYSSNLMTLVLMGPQSHEELAALAKRYFSDVPNRKVPPLTLNGPVFSRETSTNAIFFRRKSTDRVLSLYFETPDPFLNWREKPHFFVRKLLGSNAKGSLADELTRLGLATSVRTIGGFRMLGVQVDLTEKGRKDHKKVISLVFGFIQKMKVKGLPKEMFEASSKGRERALKSMRYNGSMHDAVEIAEAYLYFGGERAIERWKLLHRYSNSSFLQFLERLSWQNCRIVLSDPGEEGDAVEPITGTPYREAALEEVLPANSEGFAYPSKSPYDVSLAKPVSDKSLISNVVSRSAANGDFLVKTDTSDGSRYSSIWIQITSSIEQSDFGNASLSFFTYAKSMALRGLIDQAREAGIEVKIRGISGKRMLIQLEGLSADLVKIAEDLVKGTSEYPGLGELGVSKEFFGALKADFLGRLGEYRNDDPSRVLWDEMIPFFISGNSSDRSMYAHAKGLSRLGLHNFLREFFSKIHIRLFAYGNIEIESVDHLNQSLIGALGSKAMSKGEFSGHTVKYNYPGARKRFFVPVRGQNSNNAILLLWPTGKWSYELEAKNRLVLRLLGQEFFTQLRTVQQLGYHVHFFPMERFGFAGFGAEIQSKVYSPHLLRDRSIEFLVNYLGEKAVDLSKDQFDLLVRDLRRTLDKRPSSLRDRARRFFADTWRYGVDAKPRVERVKVLETVSLSEFREHLGALSKSLISDSYLDFSYFGKTQKASDISILPGVQKVQLRDHTDLEWSKINPYRAD